MNTKNIRTIIERQAEKFRKKSDPYKALFKPLYHWQMVVMISTAAMILIIVSAGIVFFLYGDPPVSTTTDTTQPLLDQQELEEVLSEYLDKEAQFQQLQNNPPEVIEP